MPFSQRFESLTHGQQNTYLLVLCGSVLSTALVIAPVAFHRILFRRRMRPWLVAAAHLCALAGLLVFVVTTSGALFLVFDLVLGRVWAIWVMSGSLMVFILLWVLVAALAMRHAASLDGDEP